MVTISNQVSEGFSQQQIAPAKTACASQVTIVHQSREDMRAIIQGNLIANFPVTMQYIYCAEILRIQSYHNERGNKTLGPSHCVLGLC